MSRTSAENWLGFVVVERLRAMERDGEVAFLAVVGLEAVHVGLRCR